MNVDVALVQAKSDVEKKKKFKKTERRGEI